jgi:hypothetical protein
MKISAVLIDATGATASVKVIDFISLRRCVTCRGRNRGSNRR